MLRLLLVVLESSSQQLEKDEELEELPLELLEELLLLPLTSLRTEPSFPACAVAGQMHAIASTTVHTFTRRLHRIIAP